LPNTPHFHLSSVGSTLTEAWAMAAAGEAAPFWLTADEQTQGRGRMDRHWVSLHGNLYSTLVTPPPESLHLLPFAVSLAVYNAIAHHLPEERRNAIGLKWPNDVLIDGAKTSGILIEQRTQAGQPSLIAIGIGINIAHAPDLVDRAVTHLADQGSMSTPGEVFASLRETLAQSLRQLHHAPQGIIPAWTQRATGIGGPITVQTGTERLQGTFDHLASDGALMVRLDSGAMRPIHTGDIVIKPQ
jgi:BirA family biotin operon repressor/biotin-[acetyl-CoA-carboxylase] ligase